MIAIMDQSKHKEEAWDFVEYVLSEEVQVELFDKERSASGKNRFV